MKNTLLYLLLCLLCACRTDETPLLILDTDIAPDYDDVGAMACMYALEAQGKCKVLGVMSSNLSSHTLSNIEIINRYYRHTALPVGEVKGEGVFEEGWHKKSWSEFLANKYAPLTLSHDNVPDAVSLYRELLSQAPDHSVTICSIGFLTNLSNLLNSDEDIYSPLIGKQLIALKVKQLVVMGGGFPDGNEFNIYKHADASINVAATWPTPILFCGFEIGEKVLTGKRTAAESESDNPVADAYRVALPQDNPEGRESWDQLTVLAAINGTEPYFDLIQGNIIIFPDGKNCWETTPNGRHFYMKPRVSYDRLAQEIETLMMQPVPPENNEQNEKEV